MARTADKDRFSELGADGASDSAVSIDTSEAESSVAVSQREMGSPTHLDQEIVHRVRASNPHLQLGTTCCSSSC